MTLFLPKKHLARQSSPFAYPGDQASYNQKHPVGGGARFSAVAFNGANFVNLLNAKPGSGVGSISGVTRSDIGPAVNFTSGATDKVQFSGQSTTTDADCTIGVICKFTTIGSFQYLFSAGSGGSGTAFAGNNFIPQLVQFGGSTIGTAQDHIVAGVPMFLAVSKTGTSVANFISVNLLTGKTLFEVVATPGASTGVNGTYNVGSAPNGGSPAIGDIAALMFSSRYHPLGVLQRWAADPWSFWYPSK